MSPKMVLYSYWRSSCSWRVRIALHIKGLEFEYKPVHLVKDGGEQNTQEYQAVNAMGQVPALRTDSGRIITQSMAILEYLEERYPHPRPLLPEDFVSKAKVRELCEVINSGIQPLQNLAVMNKVSDDPAKRHEWSNFWIDKGLHAVEKMLVQCAGDYCVGDEVTLADCCLVPQVYNAQRFKVDMLQFPTIKRIVERLEQLEAFVAAHPDQQPDRQ